jgi:hypothetical protein
MARGRKRTRNRNISGLRNQAPRSSIPRLPNVESLRATNAQESVETEIPPASTERQNPIEISEETIHVGIPPVNAAIPQVTNRKDESWLEDDQLDEGVQGGASGVDIRGWDVLREQIKKEMKSRSHTLPLRQVTQLVILRDFATLRLKGYEEMDTCLEIAQLSMG